MKNNNQLKILIVGSNSFCGLALSKFFIKKKTIIVGTYNKKKTKIRSKYFISKKVDLTKKIFLNENFNTLIHISSHHKINDFKKSPLKKYNENILMTKNLIQFAKKNKIKNLIFFSTIDIKKNVTPVKKKYYINSKIKSESLYSSSLNKKIFQKVLFLRLPAILGKNCNDNFLKNTIKSLKKNKTINIWDEKKLFNNFIHIEDLNRLVEGFILNKFKSKKTIIECKVKNPMNLKDTILNLKKKLKSNSKINILRSNNESKKKEGSRAQKYNFFSSKKTLLLFLKDSKSMK